MLYYNYVIILRGIYCIIKQNDIIHKKKKKTYVFNKKFTH